MEEQLDKLSPESAPHKGYIAFRYASPLTEVSKPPAGFAFVIKLNIGSIITNESGWRQTGGRFYTVSSMVLYNNRKFLKRNMEAIRKDKYVCYSLWLSVSNSPAPSPWRLDKRVLMEHHRSMGVTSQVHRIGYKESAGRAFTIPIRRRQEGRHHSLFCPFLAP